MPLPVRLPDFEHWKAQVKCQAGCPVLTDAGRYVQLIAAGRHEEAYLAAPLSRGYLNPPLSSGTDS